MHVFRDEAASGPKAAAPSGGGSRRLLSLSITDNPICTLALFRPFVLRVCYQAGAASLACNGGQPSKALLPEVLNGQPVAAAECAVARQLGTPIPMGEAGGDEEEEEEDVPHRRHRSSASGGGGGVSSQAQQGRVGGGLPFVSALTGLPVPSSEGAPHMSYAEAWEEAGKVRSHIYSR